MAELPEGWQTQDLGVPSRQGSADYLNGVWTTSGGGGGICPASQFRYTYLEDNEASGITAKVESVSGGHFYSQAGIMFREDLTAGAAQAMLLSTPTNGIMFQWRSTTSSGCSSYSLGGLGAPIWLKLTRSATNFTAYYSLDGAQWIRVGEPQVVAIGPKALVGLVVTANDDAQLTSAVFRDVALAEPVFGIHQEIWEGLQADVNTGLGALTNQAQNPRWPSSPTTNSVAQTLGSSWTNQAGVAGQRWRSLIVPPLSGDYRFGISSSSRSELRLSDVESPAGARAIAWVEAGVPYGEWLGEPNQISASVNLVAGRRYYLEVLNMRPGPAGHLSTRWELPNKVVESPLATDSPAGGLLVPFRGLDHPPGIFVQPNPVVVMDGGTAHFAVLSTNQGVLSYQWRLAGTNLQSAAARTSVLSLPSLNAALYDGLEVTAVLSNLAGAVTSAPVLLTVLADRDPPQVLRAAYIGTNLVRIDFSEPVTVESATNLLNYSFTNNVSLISAAISSDGGSVTLGTSGLIEGLTQRINVREIYDRSFSTNVVPTNSFAVFFSAPYAPETIGNGTLPGTIALRPDGYDVAGAGKDIGTGSDQFQFAYAYRAGDFDVSVRIRALSQTDAFAKAGLMLREDLSAASRYAAVLCTPSIGGVFFSSRSQPAARAVSSGNVPANIPYMWLRLRRVATQFYGYASYDGVRWQLLGTANLAIGPGAYLGMAVTSRDPAKLANAEFRDFINVTNPLEGVLRMEGEPLGPSSRTTGLAISEIMYHPLEDSQGRNLEYVELFNSQPWFQELSGYRLAGDIEFKFPEGTVLPAGAYMVVAASPADVSSAYGIANVTGPYSNRLSNAQGKVELRDKSGAMLLDARYGSTWPWPAASDGGGHSLVLRRPSYGERSPRAWAPSDFIGGSPGGTDGFGPEPAREVRINELLARSDVTPDFVELFNAGTTTVDLSGAILTDDPDLHKFKIPAGTQLPPGGLIAFDETQLGFRLDATGETAFLLNSTKTRVLDAVTFTGQQADRSFGRYPDGAAELQVLQTPSAGLKNTQPLPSKVVINEIYYNPISGDEDDEFVELHNTATNRIDVGRWKLNGAASFTFPEGTSIEPGGYAVVSKKKSRIFENYPSMNPGRVFGDFEGSLSDRGERLELLRADLTLSTSGNGSVVTNTLYVVEDAVSYGTGGRWGQWSDGGGSSLELVNPKADNRLAPNWADSDESQKAPWTDVEVTGLLDNGSGSVPINQLHVTLLGAGECLLDDVQVLRPGQANLIANGAFGANAAGWTFQGTHRLSTFQSSGGFGNGGCLRIRATGRGDTGANRIRVPLTSPLLSGETVTIRAKARWVKGNPELLLRLRGNWLEAAARLRTSLEPGTPGAQNTRHVVNPAPSITEVTHSPALPSATEPVLVTARVSDTFGIPAVRMVYRNDSASLPAQALSMNDSGTAGDALAGDGLYSVIMPAPNSRSIIAYYIEAFTSEPVVALATFPANAPARECLVGFGDSPVTGLLGSYRLWVTKTNISWWASRERNSNEPLDATFVYNGSRVVYNMQTLYSGSPFHTRNYSSPVGNLCDYVLTMPEDELVLGAQDFVLATAGNLGNDDTLQREQAAFWILRELGAPSLHRRHVLVYLNGTRRGSVYEDSQQPNSDVVEEHWPDDAEGQLFKIEDWFEFDDAGSDFQNIDATLGNFLTSGGQKKVARYRWNWRPRAVKESAHDFTNLFHLVDATRTTRPEPYTTLVDNLVDVEEWMRVLALERIVGNWDSYAWDRGKNMYAYKPENGRWQLIPWDIDFVFDLGRSATYGLFSGQDQAIDTMRSHPPFARAYWRAFYDAVNGPMLSSRSGPMLDAKHAGLIASGVSATVPNAIKNYIAARRDYILSQLATVAANFNVNAPTITGNMAVLSGSAPVGVRTIEFNGQQFPVTWTGVTSWTAAVPLRPGVNQILITGRGSNGEILPGASRNISATYNGPDAYSAPPIVINEIQYSPLAPGAEFVELYNPSATLAVDLSGWVFNGLSYQFPAGTLLAPRGYHLLARDREAMASAYGITTPVNGVFDGALQSNGETLTLQSAPTNGVEIVKVRYEAAAPWPTNANGIGHSLQLVDASKENWRVGNWEVAVTNTAPTPQWVFVAVSGVPTASVLYMYLGSAGEIYLDDVQLVQGTAPGVGQNLLVNGGFESSLGAEWAIGSIFSQSSRSTTVKRSGSASLRMVSTGRGSTQATSISQNITPALSAQTHTLSFWYLQTTNGGPLVLRLSQNGITTGPIDPAPPGGTVTAAPSTPGKANSVARTLTAFPPLFINEVQPENLSGLTNSAGVRGAWLELYNPSTNFVRLDGLWLSTNFNDLARWSFPTGAIVPARGFKIVFADAFSSLNTSNEPHTSFPLPPKGGGVVLSRQGDRGAMQVLDYITYTNIPADRSFGSIPDGQSFLRRQMVFPTPGGTNNGARPALTVVINEWMAENVSTRRDPVDDDFEDWFELHNYGDDEVDLGGYYLSDSLADKLQFQVPQNGTYVIPAKGFIVVWADNETGQNAGDRKDLHVNFRLAKEGEMLGLFAPDGSAVDLLSFGAQDGDVSQGRFPDGAIETSTLGNPTPGTNNVMPNTAPRLEPVPDQVVYVGQTLELQLVATDNDLPSQTITFALASSDASDMGINAATGLFRWTPTMPQMTNVTVVARDSGRPALNASRTFSVTVLALPKLKPARLGNGIWALRVESVPAKSYQLEWAEDLMTGAWTPAGVALVGTGGTVEFPLQAPATGQRFYRIRIQ